MIAWQMIETIAAWRYDLPIVAQIMPSKQYYEITEWGVHRDRDGNTTAIVVRINEDSCRDKQDARSA